MSPILAAGLAQGTQRYFVSYIAIKKEKEVMLNPLLIDVCDNYLLNYGRYILKNNLISNIFHMC